MYNFPTTGTGFSTSGLEGKTCSLTSSHSTCFIGEYRGLTSSHMNTIELTESTRVSGFQLYHMYAIPTLFRDPGMQKHLRKLLGFGLKLNGNSTKL